MRLYWLALGWLLGITLAQQQASILNISALVALFILSLAPLVVMGWMRTSLAQRSRHPIFQSCQAASHPIPAFMVVLSCVGFGFIWACSMAHVRLQDRFPSHLENTIHLVQFQVIDLPVQMGTGMRSSVQVMVRIESGAPEALSRDVLLSWSGVCARGCELQVKPGQVWRARVQWRAPHGRLNEFGPDPEQRVHQQGVNITARVQGRAVFIGSTAHVTFQTRLASLRHSTAQRMLDALDHKPFAGVLVALSLGDQQGIDRQQWEWFSRAGISHLVAISGTHVSMLASVLGLFVCLCARRLRWRSRQLVEWVPLSVIFALAGSLCALGYCLLAGWGIPAQRTFYTLVAGAWAVAGRVRLAAHDCLAIALLIMTTLDPWAVLTHGLWLSFAAVTTLMMIAQNSHQRLSKTKGWLANARAVIVAVLKLQWAVTLAMLPLVAWMFHVVSLISLPANLWAIPWVSLVVTPLALLLALFAALPVPMVLLKWLAMVAHWAALVAFTPIEWLAQWTVATWEVPAGPWWLFMISMLGVLIALAAPSGVMRTLGWVLVLPQMLWRPETPEQGGWKLVAFDIGQGSAVLIQTTHHQVLFDTGWKNGDSDAVSRVVLPQLRAMGVSMLDDVIVSHPDLDHIGGLDSLMRARTVRNLRGAGLAPRPYTPCRVGQRWNYDGVWFRMMAPRSECAQHLLEGAQRNRCSCVLLVEGAWHKALLPGDIDAGIETSLLDLAASAHQSTKPRARPSKAHQKFITKNKKRKTKTNVKNNQTNKPKRARKKSQPSAVSDVNPDLQVMQTNEVKDDGERLKSYLPIEVVLMAHHGSKSSSVAAWVQTLKPLHAIAQAGHHNHFGHPDPGVEQRWRKQGADVWVSSRHGALRVDSSKAGLHLVYARALRRRYWHVDIPSLPKNDAIQAANLIE